MKEELIKKYNRYLIGNSSEILLTDYADFSELAFRGDGRPPTDDFYYFYSETKRGIFDIGFMPKNKSPHPFCGYVARNHYFTPFAEYSVNASFQTSIAALFPFDIKKERTWIYIVRPSKIFPTYELQYATGMPYRNIFCQEFSTPEIRSEHIIGAIACDRYYYHNPIELEQKRICKTSMLLHYHLADKIIWNTQVNPEILKKTQEEVDHLLGDYLGKYIISPPPAYHQEDLTTEQLFEMISSKKQYALNIISKEEHFNRLTLTDFAETLNTILQSAERNFQTLLEKVIVLKNTGLLNASIPGLNKTPFTLVEYFNDTGGLENVIKMMLQLGACDTQSNSNDNNAQTPKDSFKESKEPALLVKPTSSVSGRNSFWKASKDDTSIAKPKSELSNRRLTI